MGALLFFPGPAASHGPPGGECDMEKPRVGEPLLGAARRASRPPSPSASTAPSSASTRRSRPSHASDAQPDQARAASFFCRPYTNARVRTLRAQWLERAANERHYANGGVAQARVHKDGGACRGVGIE